MNRTRIEENLLILLDPSGRMDDEGWRFIRPADPTTGEEKQPAVFSYNRSDLLRYLIRSLSLRFDKAKTKVRRILHINDGLVCCFFSAGNPAGYRAFNKRHVAQSGGFRRRLAMMLPPILRADRLFIAVEQRPEAGQQQGPRLLDSLDFMFYSNAPGKLLLTRAETFAKGSGHVFKTTSSPDYGVNLKREYESVRTVSENIGQHGLVPDIENPFRVNGRCYYPEAYLNGEDLRAKLRSLGRSSSHLDAISVLERLDDWFSIYHASFQGPRKPLDALYAELFPTVLALNANVPAIVPLVKYAEEFVAGIESRHGGVVPVLAHNDLWPGNFIVKGDRLTAIDWERATPQSAPLFDYFWMIISALLEYRVGQNGIQDYSVAFRQFLTLDDELCRYARGKLDCFLEYLGFEKAMRVQFTLLFLMEWSVQGARALGAATEMDRLAQGELIDFVRSHPDVFNLELSPDLPDSTGENGGNN